MPPYWQGVHVSVTLILLPPAHWHGKVGQLKSFTSLPVQVAEKFLGPSNVWHMTGQPVLTVAEQFPEKAHTGEVPMQSPDTGLLMDRIAVQLQSLSEMTGSGKHPWQGTMDSAEAQDSGCAGEGNTVGCVGAVKTASTAAPKVLARGTDTFTSMVFSFGL